ncbi:unnamed protein product [Clonostachys solani]|uniref:Uncharacterized protein n=1 Tax=Clonostachys solani TaxID=160281 RepID=A0A9N9W3G6_9HYPO|nr:unnamed protein product [Clonostachys solani]
MDSYDSSHFNTFGLDQPLPSFQKLKGEREQLPVTRNLNDFWDEFTKNDVLIVSGGTGSGKTTQIPQFVAYKAQEMNIRGRIACTQPRRLAAVKVAERVAQEAGCELGAQVGFKIRDDHKISEETQLIYMTDGSMVAQAFNDRNFSEYHTVFIDEAHECNNNIYILMALVRRAVKARVNSRSKLKVIVMSATISVNKFVDYFKDDAQVAQIHMPGITHKVDLLYLGETPRHTSSQPHQQSDPEPNIGHIVEEACRIVAKIVRNQFPTGNILVFMPGVIEVEMACQRIRKSIGEVDVISLYSAQSGAAQNAIFRSSTERRQCIVSTNIAETSITIPDIVYVIDTGIEKVKRLMPRIGAFEVRPRPISKASANQRAGRCGRTRPGVCFRMYTEQDFERNLRDEPDVEIARDDVSAVYLKALAFGFAAATLPFIDLPPFENLAYANELLLDLGYINDQFQVTNAGKRAAQNPFEPNWTYAIDVAKVKYPHLAQHIVAIATICSSMHSIFAAAPARFMASSLASRAEFADPMSDLITELNALYAFETEEPKLPDDRELDQWCNRRFLNRLVMGKILLQRNSAVETMQIRFDEAPVALNSQDRENIRRILARTFFRNIAFRIPSSGGEVRYRTIHGNFEVIASQDSMLNTGGHPWVMYDTLNRARSNTYMTKVTHVEPEWIADLPFFQDDRMKKNYHGNIVQKRVKEALDKAREP